MHQTFYIDIDEEITSIVDRMRKAKASEVVLVIPKRAQIIQSIVNLKLLKKEAEKKGIQIMIVTQDKLGKLLIEKAGILVQNKLDETLEEENIVFEDNQKEVEEKNKIRENSRTKKDKERVANIGSESFFSDQDSREKNEKVEISDEKNEKDFEKITNKELVTDVGKTLGKKRFFGRKKKKIIDLSNVNVSKIDIDDSRELQKEEKKAKKIKQKTSPKNKANMQKLANFFQEDNHEKERTENDSRKKIKQKQKDVSETHLSGKFWKMFLFFGTFVFLGFVLVGAYLFFPKVELRIYPKIKTTSEDFQLKGSVELQNLSANSETISIKEIEVDEEYSQEFSSSGEEGISNQKARGKVTIYNEYSSSPQPLVATTRFLTEDGKLFRLISGTTIPGMKTENGKTEPGKIEVLIIADKAGSDFNIGPARFSIPGFKSSGESKYLKFYAISTESMAGGGSGNEKVKTVTKSDIDYAKSKMNSSFDEKNKKVLEEKAGQNWIVLDETIKNEGAQYVSSNSPGEVAEKFSLTMKVKRKAFVFSQNEVKEIVAKKIAEKNNGYVVKNENINLDFGKADADWEKKEVVIRFRASVDMGASLDLDNIKRGILGKNEEEVKSFLGTYSEIEKIDLDYWPFFVTGKIPMYEKRVTVKLDKD